MTVLPFRRHAKTPADWIVGETVIIKDVNRPAREGRIEKVGRTLLHVSDSRYPSWKPETYRIEDGRANDQYGHRWVVTPEEDAAAAEYAGLVKQLRDAGITLGQQARHWPVEVLYSLVSALPAPSEEANDV